MFRETVTVKTTSLAATVLIAAPLLYLVVWIFSWYAVSRDVVQRVFENAVDLALLFCALVALVLSIVSLARGGTDKMSKRENVLILIVSLVVFAIYLFGQL